MDLYEHNAATTTIVQRLISDKFVQKVLSIYKSAIESTNSPPSNLVIIFSSLYFLHFISQWIALPRNIQIVQQPISTFHCIQFINI